MGRMDAILKRVPPERDRYIDFLRVASIGVVIVWHWSLSILHWRDDGRLAMPNPINDVPGGWLATWLLQVVPIFFIVGGYVNGAGWWSSGDARAFLTRRLRRLLLPLSVFVVVWAIFELATSLLIRNYPGVFNYGEVVFTPLWFVGAYVGVVLLTPITATWHRRAQWATLGVLVGVMVLVDVGRFGLDVDAFKWINTGLVWVVVHQLGYFYRDGTLTRFGARIGVLLVISSLAMLAVLTGIGPYPRSMVSVPGQAFSNMYPTTAAIVGVAVFQLGLILLLRRPVTRFLRRPRVYGPVVAINLVIMTIFVWHMTAVLIVLAVARELGLDPLSEPTAIWWFQRPIFVIVPGLVLASFVVIFARFEASLGRREDSFGQAE